MEGIENVLAARAQAALVHWALPAQRPELIKYRENAVFRVRLADGGAAALRLHRPGYHDEAALSSELLWMADLRSRGIVVPEPIATGDGRLLVRLETEDAAPQFADLIGWVEGEPLGAAGVPFIRSPTELRVLFGTIGREMARLHGAADRFDIPAEFSRPSWDAAGLVGEQPFWGRFWDCPGLDPADRSFLAALRTRLADDLAALGGLDHGLIHADLVRENVLVDGDRVTFIDFDDSGFGFRIFDLATTLLRNRSEPDYPLLREALLAGYASIRPEIEAEFIHLPLFLLLRGLTYIGWAGARPELSDNGVRLKRYLADARLLLADYERA